MIQATGLGLAGAVGAASSVAAAPDHLEIVAPANGSVDYSFTCTGTVALVQKRGYTAAETDEESVVENDDGTYSAAGRAKSGYGDTFSIEGDITAFEPTEGDYTLYLNGNKTTRDDLVKTQQTREHWYSFEATGDTFADYYIEVEDGGDMIASTVDDAIVESDLHWINDDGTKAAGRVDPGETHAYAFDTLVADVTVDGEAHPTVDGSDSDLSYYPRDSASGDHWKGYFPWQIAGESREHWYSFEATGDTYADYYLEVEDGGETIPSLANDANIEYEFFWISSDGTKAAGRIDPGETHAYTFDTLVADVTIDGEAYCEVNGSESDLDYYPRDGATGDGWKSGFPWQDSDDGVDSGGGGSSGGDGVVGGGSGYENTVPESDATVVVSTESGLRNELSSATSGDIVYVDGAASIDLGSDDIDVSDGVTLASDRGINNADGALLYTNNEPSQLITLNGTARLTGVRVKGPHSGDDWSWDNYANGVSTRGANEIDNCEVWGFGYSGIRNDSGGDAHIHHNVIIENNGEGLGYGVNASSGSPVIEYNYFNNNRHSVDTTGDNPGFTLRYNHFGPKMVMYPLGAHAPAGNQYEIHNNVAECVFREWDGNRSHSVNFRGVPDTQANIHDNWFFNDQAPDGETDVNGQTIVQEDVSDWSNVDFYSNYYGEGADVTYSDIIPGYDGWRS